MNNDELNQLAQDTAKQISEWEAKEYGKPAYSFASQQKEQEVIARLIYSVLEQADKHGYQRGVRDCGQTASEEDDLSQPSPLKDVPSVASDGTHANATNDEIGLASQEYYNGQGEVPTRVAFQAGAKWLRDCGQPDAKSTIEKAKDAMSIQELADRLFLRDKHGYQRGARDCGQDAEDTMLVREIAEESAVSYQDDRMRYVEIQMTTSTWGKLQQRYLELTAVQTPTPDSK